MARRVFLHIGAPKTGTSYLQALLRANTRALAEQGVLLPGNRGDHYRFRLAVVDLIDRRERRPETYTVWERILVEVRAWPDTVLITNELLSTATEVQAKRTIDALAPAEVHVIYTARDLARAVPAEWQQSIKAGAKASMGTFVQRLRERPPSPSEAQASDPGPVPAGPSGSFIKRDMCSVLSRWGASLDSDHVHVVTLPADGSGPGELWRRFASVVDIDPDSCVEPADRLNESLGAAEAELLRRVNVALSETTDHEHSLKEWVRHNLALGILSRRPAPTRFGLRADEHAWAVDRARSQVDAIRHWGFDVVGDLDDLIPLATPSSSIRPDDVEDGDINAVAVDTIAQLVIRLHTRRRVERNRVIRVARLRRRVARLERQVGRSPWARLLRRRVGRSPARTHSEAHPNS